MRKIIEYINEGWGFFPIGEARTILKNFNSRSKGWNLNKTEDVEDFIAVYIKWCFNNDVDVKQGLASYIKNFIFASNNRPRFGMAQLAANADAQKLISKVYNAADKEDAEKILSLIWKSEKVDFDTLVDFVACLPLDMLEEFTLEQQ